MSAHHDKYVGQGADRNASITLFKTGNRAGRGASTRGEIRHSDATPQSCAMKITTEPFQGGSGFRRTHLNSSYTTTTSSYFIIYDEL